ncbi:M23 family metallopeptidase [Nocardia mangyaensis]|uniref:M23 family metallopeptidase n=1 Tax=Nocardia mangyaensis TaxID=2213200 RepID=UPI00267564F6|nr:M23 family metallopeptidase [Nocardia mangyaensis]MDO3647758.1 M23 family metallopeptidase [Nocardia mangyaensis]
MKRVVLALYRVRIPLYYLAAVILIGNALLGRLLSTGGVRELRLVVVFAALGVAALCLALAFLAPRLLPEHPVRVVAPPVRGRWVGVNSPASQVPSHGVRAYGQAYAIDVVADPVDTPRPEFGRRMMRAVSKYPAFGEPVFAMLDGEVVRASGWRRDHRARSNAWGIFYMMAEGVIREIGGPGFVVGNHVTIRSDDGVYATVAHLRQGSLTVKVGDRVTAGSIIGQCGNSGNTSEPHVHAQLMDRASFWTARGLPMTFAGITLDDEDEKTEALPANDQHMTVDSPVCPETH